MISNVSMSPDDLLCHVTVAKGTHLWEVVVEKPDEDR